VCNDENASQNVQPAQDRMAKHTPTTSAVLADSKSNGNKGNISVPGSELKFGPSMLEWASKRQAVGGTSQPQGGARTCSFSPAPAAGRKSQAENTSRRHYSKDTLFRSSSADRKTHAKKQDELQPPVTAPDFLTPSVPDGDSKWSHSLRETAPQQPWTPRITVPQGPRFRTPNRSRSVSRNSCTPGTATPEASDTPRGRPLSWQQSLRGRGQSSASCERAASVDNTPQRSKKSRRSLSHWWQETSAPAKVTSSRSDLSTPKLASMTPDVESCAESENSVEPHPRTDPVLLLNNMSKLSKRLSVERKRLQLDELTRDQAESVESSTVLETGPNSHGAYQGSGRNVWLHSLRGGRSTSCPAPAMTPRLTLAREPNMHTTHRAHSRTERSTDRSSVGTMSESVHLQPRERAAVAKYLERAAHRSTSASSRSAFGRHVEAGTTARSRSAQRSNSATPERRSLSVDQRKREALEKHAARSRSAQRSTSANSKCAFGRHLEEPASRSHSAQHSAREQQQVACESRPFTPRERAALAKHLDRVALGSAKLCSSTQDSGCTTPERQEEPRVQAEPSRRTEAEPPRLSPLSRESSHPCERAAMDDLLQRARAQLPGHRARPAAPSSEVLPDKPEESTGDEEWVRKATNPQERAERARAVNQAKFDQARSTERARVFVFQRSRRPSTRAAPSGNAGVTKGQQR